MCFGGSPTPSAPPPPPPPQYAQTPEAAQVRSSVATVTDPGTGTLLTGGMGDITGLSGKNKKTLLGG